MMMAATAVVTIGVAMPSLSPLSTFSVCRIRYGTRWSVITTAPSAASVGPSAAPSSSAYHGLMPSTPTAASDPATTVSGSPTPNSRA